MERGGVLLAGWGAWTLSEYALHRWTMHGRRGLLSRPHRQHHAQPEAVDRTDALAASARLALVLGAAGLLGWSTASAPALAFLCGWAAGYVSYEVLHWRSHESEPATFIRRYELWLRRRHLHHHVANAAANYGVTVDLWDRLFGTFEETGRLTLPRPVAPRWLTDEKGDVRAEYRASYELTAGS